MLKIQAQSSSTSRRRFAAPSSSPSPAFPSSSPMPIPTEDSLYAPPATTLHPPNEHHGDASPSVSVAIMHSPLHLGCFFQPPTARTTNSLNPTPGQTACPDHDDQQQGCSAFSLASPACARVFPLRRCDWEGGGGGGAGAALFAAAAAVEGGGGGDGGGGGHASAEEVPREERLQYRSVESGILGAGKVQSALSASWNCPVLWPGRCVPSNQYL